jgi:hypothetical protein
MISCIEDNELLLQADTLDPAILTDYYDTGNITRIFIPTDIGVVGYSRIMKLNSKTGVYEYV